MIIINYKIMFDDLKESNSLFDATISEIDAIYSNIKEKLEKINKLKIVYKEEKEKRLLSINELSVIQESILYHENYMKNDYNNLLKLLKTAQELWKNKQELMKSYFEQGILDVNVAKEWENSLEKSDIYLKKISTSLELIDN